LLVFFDDILIYSKNLVEHVQHLRVVLGVLRSNSLFARRSKCYFVVYQVEYLGHIILEKSVSTDPSKITTIVKWPLRQTLKQLRRFLGLTRYYRRFVQGYGVVARSLTDMLKIILYGMPRRCKRLKS